LEALRKMVTAKEVDFARRHNEALLTIEAYNALLLAGNDS